MEKLNIYDFWWYNNTDCWKIQREGMVDFYLYLPTMRYIYKSSTGKSWRGTKNPHPMIFMSKRDRSRVKKFKNEHEAVTWLSGR